MSNLTLSVPLFTEMNTLDPIIVAYSGGVDSTVLLDLLRKYGFSVIVAHVNHGKRDASKQEEQYIIEFCKKNHLSLEIFHLQETTENFQSEARLARYDFFYRVVKQYHAQGIATAHHADDNLESMIINFVRGSNLYGYAGIQPCTPYRDTLLFRPLLRYRKSDLIDYATTHQLYYFEDESNHEDAYFRNRVRHYITPLLEQECPALERKIEHFSTQLIDAFHYLRQQAKTYLNQNIIDISTFQTLPIALQREIINLLLEQYQIPSSWNKIHDIIRMIQSDTPNATYDLTQELILIKSYHSCHVEVKTGYTSIEYTIDLDEYLDIPGYGRFYFSKTLPDYDVETVKIWYNISCFPMLLRTKQPGDRLSLKAGHQKVKDFFINKKVPKVKRETVLLLVDQNQNILWIQDYYKKTCNQTPFIYFIWEKL